MLMIALNREADRPISVDVSTSENTATGRVAIRSDNIITHSHIFQILMTIMVSLQL